MFILDMTCSPLVPGVSALLYPLNECFDVWSRAQTFLQQRVQLWEQLLTENREKNAILRAYSNTVKEFLLESESSESSVESSESAVPSAAASPRTGAGSRAALSISPVPPSLLDKLDCKSPKLSRKPAVLQQSDEDIKRNLGSAWLDLALFYLRNKFLLYHVMPGHGPVSCLTEAENLLRQCISLDYSEWTR